MQKFVIFLFFILFCNIVIDAQTNGELNQPIKTDQMPSWAHLMYDNPIDFIKLEMAYRDYYKSRAFEKSSYTRYYKRLIMSHRNLMDGDGKSMALDIDTKEKFFQKNKLQSRTGAPVWKAYDMETFFLENNRKACPWQVNVYALEVSKSNPNILIAGAETAGLFKTTDKGKSWTQISKNYINGTEAIAIHPKNPDTVFIGVDGIIRRSVNGGDTWTNVYTLAGMWVYDFDIPVDRANIILAATNKGFYRSTNSGASWTKIFNEASCDMKIHPTKSNIVYALKYNAASANYTPFKSIDYGASFAEKKSGWYTNADDGLRMAVTSADPKRIYAVALTKDKGPYLMRSNDEGETWTIQARGSYTGYDSPNFPLDNWQGYYDLSIVASQTNADEVITGTGTMVKSTNGGSNFVGLGGYSGNFPLHPDFQASVAIGSDSWIATDGGLTYSTDFFTKLDNAQARNKGINGSDFWGFDAGWNENVFVGGRYHNGNTVYHENYQTKFIRMGGAENSTGYINPIRNRDIYFSDVGAYSMPYTYDTAWTYFHIPCGKYPNESYYPTEHSDMVWSPICYSTVYLGNANGFYRSINNAVDFKLLFSVPNANSSIEAIEISRSNPDVIYFTERNNNVGDGNIWRSNDGGLTFVKIPNPNVPNGQRRLQSIALSESDENFLYVAYRSGNATNKVYFTKDGGKNWTNFTTPRIATASISDILLQYGTDGGVYIAADDGAMYHRKPGQPDWTVYNDGLSITHFTRNLRPFYRDAKLISGGNTGIWEIPFIEKSKPIAQPTVDKLTTNCIRDTFYFDDYSAFEKDALASYEWNFPGASYISNPRVQNPKVVYSQAGSYDVSLKISNAQGTDTKSIKRMIQIISDQCSPDTIAGKMLDLSGKANYCTIPTIPKLKNATGFTCMSWIKINKPQDCFTQIISNWSSNVGFGFGFAFQGYVPTTNLTFFWQGVPYQLTSSFNLDTTKWIHVAMVVYDDSVRLYRNGDYWTRKGNFKGYDLGSTPWVVGQGVPGQCGDFDGQIDELKLFKRSLTQDEIRLNMHLIPTKHDTDLVAYYQFNENTNEIFYDKINTSHMLNGAGLQPISSAPVATGISQKLNTLNQGKNNFDATGLQLHFNAKPVVTNFEIATYRLNSIPSPNPVPTGLEYLPQQFIIRSWGAINNTKLDSITLLDPLRISSKEEAQPSLFKLHYRNDPNDYKNTWQAPLIGRRASRFTKEIVFDGKQNYTGNYFLEIPKIDYTNQEDIKSEVNYFLQSNPVKNELIITSNLTPHQALIQINDQSGKILWKQNITLDGKFLLDVHHWSPGVYFITIANQKIEFIKL